MNKNTLIMIICALAAIGLATLVSLAIIKVINEQTAEVKVTFDSKGGDPVETIKVKKGSEIILPTTNREGYNFLGWYDESNQKVASKVKIKSYTKYTAKWEEVPKTDNVFTVTFDSDGGSAVNKLVVECGKELKLPTAPSKEGYKFVTWQDKNETPILDKALLTCEDVTLTAKWEKEEEKKKEEPKKETPKPEEKPVEPVKTYVCPEGYQLNGTNCILEGTVIEKCEGERVYEYNGKCVTINYYVRKDPQATCGKTTVHTGGGHTEEVQGELFKMGANFCFFKEVTDPYENSQMNCTSRGHRWNSQNNKCYYYRGEAAEFVTNTCTHLSNYAFIENPNSYQGVNGLNGGCFPISEKKPYCEEGFNLTNGKCLKTIEATYQ